MRLVWHRVGLLATELLVRRKYTRGHGAGTKARNCPGDGRETPPLPLYELASQVPVADDAPP
jgi:hypothetical protein